MYIIYGTRSELANPTLKNLSIRFDPEIKELAPCWDIKKDVWSRPIPQQSLL